MISNRDDHNQKPLTSPGCTEILMRALHLTPFATLGSLSITVPQFPHLINSTDTTPMMEIDFLGSSWEKKERLHQGPILQQP